MSTESKRIISLYQTHAQAWAEARLRDGRFDEKHWLDRFLTLLPIDGAILDLGCGAGVPVAQ